MQRVDARCELAVRGNGRHIQQLLTGFFELARAGVISLTVREYHDDSQDDCLVIRAVINGQRVIYDENDSHSPPTEVERQLSSVDHYFKRNYDAAYLQPWPEHVRVWPLGLNYVVTSPRNAWYWGTRPFDSRRLLEAAARGASGIARLAGMRDHRFLGTKDFEWLPVPSSTETVLFMTQAWETTRPHSDYVIKDRTRINEMRAACIRAARREFGSRFYGGFAATEFAKSQYGDCIVPEGEGTKTAEVLRRSRDAAVCVTTRGLHGAIGWKLAEYVASSRAIVSEHIDATIPGGFSEGVHYLDFTTVDEFVAAVDRLLSDQRLRLEMMRANWLYYNAWVRPDAKVLNTLLIVTGAAPEAESARE
jgi:hypothetical protein